MNPVLNSICAAWALPMKFRKAAARSGFLALVGIAYATEVPIPVTGEAAVAPGSGRNPAPPGMALSMVAASQLPSNRNSPWPLVKSATDPGRSVPLAPAGR